MIAQAQKSVKMAKYIDLDLAIDEIQKNKCGDLDYDCGIDVALAELKTMPAADVVERKKGKWTVGADMPPMRYRNGKPKKFWQSLRYCSVCGHEAFDDSDWGEQLFAWCPYCGADMRGGEC